MFFSRLGMRAAAFGAVALAGLMSAAPASAIATFASYSAKGSGANIYWKNNGTTTSNGTGGSLYTISSAGATTAGPVQISFSFQDPNLSAVTNVTANFTLNATVTSKAATTAGPFKIQSLVAGSFTITTSAPITIGTKVFATGSNLLTGVFTQGSIFGMTNGTSGSFSSSTSGGGTISYTSDFIDFRNSLDRDFSLSLTQILSPLTSSSGKALRTFSALSTGSFSSDQLLPRATNVLVNTDVPEATTWAMFLGGFGVMGAALRRRRPTGALA